MLGRGETLASVPSAVALPDGVRAVWDLDRAQRDTTPTRERVCLNGLWRWQPADPGSAQVPDASWGYFKVPGSWPGITDYMQKDSQTVFLHPDWGSVKLGTLTAAWYEREFTVPADWKDRRISIAISQLNSFAAVFLDGKLAGEVRFPSGELDLTNACEPGRTHRISLLVVALPLKGVMQSYTDSASARLVKGTVARRGLCGDVFLVGTPPGARLAGVRVETSVRRRNLTVRAALTGLIPTRSYTLKARVTDPDGVAWELSSTAFTERELKEGGCFEFTQVWVPQRFWDLHTPANLCTLELKLVQQDQEVCDVFWSERFGFRELWIEGHDFKLNGTRLFLSAVPLDLAQVGAAWATYDAARESLERLKSFGINFVYTHNYDCEPGSHIAFDDILRAADDAGMLVALTQPHFSHYTWPASEQEAANGYADHAAFYASVAGNHPSVVMYAMSHNATGYNEDMNPDMMDGIQAPRDTWALKNVALARRAEAIVSRLDSTRIVYHHASGNLGPMHPVNFYPNFAPIQELSDWFETWATRGMKPLFLCEYGAPFTWDWTMYRGWFKGEREFGSARVPWEFCLAEWNAQFLGDRAFPAGEPEKANLRWEARQFRAGQLWHRWDYPSEVGSSRFTERYPVIAAYLTDNWRAFRTWGVSALSPWEYGHYWKLRDGVDRSRKALPVDWDRLQRPGFSPDYLDQRFERMDLAFERTDWIATPAAEALYRNNRPLLAWIAGKRDRFTSKDHVFLPGECVEKQIIVINNSRVPVTANLRWSINLPQPTAGESTLQVNPGQQARVPVEVKFPSGMAPGRYTLSASVRFDTGEEQVDQFELNVLASPVRAEAGGKIALFDPKGVTAEWLRKQGIPHQAIDAGTDLAPYGTLLVGKGALSLTEAAPDISRVRDGLKVVLFEQTAEVLEKRFGFRVAEYGLRQVFPRVPDHPIVAGLTQEHLRDWRGEARLLPPRLRYEMQPRRGPTVLWCGLPVPRLWRCGNQGNVASVLIEKPARGDFLPILDGGYALQYSPLLEYREGRGLVVFCQLDVTDRTEADPVAEILVRNLLRTVSTWKPEPRRRVVFAGDEAGRRHLEAIGAAPVPFEGAVTDADLLVVGPGAAGQLTSHTNALARWLESGGRVLGLGLDQTDLDALPVSGVRVRRAEHISTGFDALARGSALAGVGPADVHNRDPRQVPLVTAGAAAVGNGVLATRAGLVLCQLVPWQFASESQMNLKRTHRRLAFLVSRLLGNQGVDLRTPLLERFQQAVDPARQEAPRWLQGFYLDTPEEWDDPYRFFRW